jgi:uncharacterized repeat protein (TIGR01451 family)
MGLAGTDYDFGEKLPPTSDLGIVKTASAPISSYGDQLTYTLAVTNYGSSDAQNVVVKDTLPADVTYVSGSGDGWTVTQSGQIITATRPTLAVGATSNITIVVTVPTHNDTLTNDSTVTSDTPDNNPSNNESKVTTKVRGPGNPHPQSGPPLSLQGYVISKTQLTGLPFTNPKVLGSMALSEAVAVTLTGHLPTMGETLQTMQALVNGSLTAQNLISSTWHSSAHYSQVANQLYRQYLNRLPTSDERAAVVQAMRSGATVQSQAAAILASPAYQALHPSTDELAVSLYTDLVGHTPDGVTQQALIQSMGNETLDAFIGDLQNTPDAINRAINQVYLNTVRRDATDAELARFAPQVQAGTLTTDQLAQRLLGSQEFYQLAYHSIH